MNESSSGRDVQTVRLQEDENSLMMREDRRLVKAWTFLYLVSPLATTCSYEVSVL